MLIDWLIDLGRLLLCNFAHGHHSIWIIYWMEFPNSPLSCPPCLPPHKLFLLLFDIKDLLCEEVISNNKFAGKKGSKKRGTDRNLIHAKIFSVSSGWCRAVDRSSVRAIVSSCRARSVEVVYHLRIKLICSLGLATACVSATATSTAAATSSHTVVSCPSSSRRFWLAFGLAVWYISFMYDIDTQAPLPASTWDLRHAITQCFDRSWRRSFGGIKNNLNLKSLCQR